MPSIARKSEVEIAAPIVATLREKGWAVRTEIPVVLAGETVSVDILCRAAGENGRDVFNVFECKRSLTNELLDQCFRWLGRAHQITAVCGEPSHQSPSHKARVFALERKGCGLRYVGQSGAVTTILRALFNPEAETTILEHAFDRCEAGHDAPAGSAAVKRNGEAQGQGWEVASYLREFGPSEWSDIPKAIRRGMTAAAARKLIVRGEWPMLAEDGFPRSVFSAVEVLAK